MVFIHSPFQCHWDFPGNQYVTIQDIFYDRSFLYVVGNASSITNYWNLNIWIGDFLRTSSDSVQPYIPSLLQFKTNQNTFWAVYQVLSVPSDFDAGLPLIIENQLGNPHQEKYKSYLAPLVELEQQTVSAGMKHILIMHLDQELWKYQALPLAVHQWKQAGITHFIFTIQSSLFSSLFGEMIRHLEDYYTCTCTVFIIPKLTPEFPTKDWFYLLSTAYSYRNHSMIQLFNYVLPSPNTSLNKIKSYVLPPLQVIKLPVFSGDFYETSPKWSGSGYLLPSNGHDNYVLEWVFASRDIILSKMPVFPFEGSLLGFEVDRQMWRGICIHERYQLIKEPRTMLRVSHLGDFQIPAKVKISFDYRLQQIVELGKLFRSDRQPCLELPERFMDHKKRFRDEELHQLKTLVQRQNLKFFMLIYPKSVEDLAILEIEKRQDAQFFIILEHQESKQQFQEVLHPGVQIGFHLPHPERFDLIWFLQSPSEILGFQTLFQDLYKIRHPNFVLGGVYHTEREDEWAVQMEKLAKDRAWQFLQPDNFWTFVHPGFFQKLEHQPYK